MNVTQPSSRALLACLLMAGPLISAEPGEVDRWSRTLRTGSEEQRIEACFALQELGPEAAPAAPALVETLQAEGDTLPVVAAYALASIGEAAADSAPAVVARLKGAEPSLRLALLEALRAFCRPEDPRPELWRIYPELRKLQDEMAEEVRPRLEEALACILGDEGLVARRLWVRLQDRHGLRPAEERLVSRLEEYVEGKARGADLRDMNSGGLLVLAALAGAEEEAERLRAMGFSPNAALEETTALHAAARAGRLKMVRWLLAQGASVDPRDEMDATPLTLAATAGHPHVVEALLEEGATPTVRDWEKKTLLHTVRDPRVAELLLEHGADPKALDEFERTPLHEAARRGDPDLALVLVRHRAPLEAEDLAGDTPRRLALQAGHESVVRMLEAHGARR